MFIIEFVVNLFHSWVALKSTPVEVYGAIAPQVLGALIIVGGALVSQLLADDPDFPGLEGAALTEAQLNKQRLDLTNRAEGLLGAPSAMENILKSLSGSGGSLLPRSLEEARGGNGDLLSEIFGSIDFASANEFRDINQLLGHTGSGTGATQALAGITSREQAAQDAQIASFMEDLITGLLERQSGNNLVSQSPDVIDLTTNPGSSDGIFTPLTIGGN